MEVEDAPANVSGRTALSEIHNDRSYGTPKSTSPDEVVIMQRGPRCKPETWSPYEFDRTDLLGSPKNRTPEKRQTRRVEVSSKLRRRLNLSFEETCEAGEEFGRRLRVLGRHKFADV